VWNHVAGHQLDLIPIGVDGPEYECVEAGLWVPQVVGEGGLAADELR
jgi:hypothetical protein